MLRAGGACAALLAIIVASACADSERADLSQIPADAGTPDGYAACNATFFKDYLKACTLRADCGGVLQCDQSRKFGATLHCHVRLCEQASECVAEFKNLCTGDDFHYECVRISPLVPKECRLVEGPPP